MSVRFSPQYVGKFMVSMCQNGTRHSTFVISFRFGQTVCKGRSGFCNLAWCWSHGFLHTIRGNGPELQYCPFSMSRAWRWANRPHTGANPRASNPNPGRVLKVWVFFKNQEYHCCCCASYHREATTAAHCPILADFQPIQQLETHHLCGANTVHLKCSALLPSISSGH